MLHWKGENDIKRAEEDREGHGREHLPGEKSGYYLPYPTSGKHSVL